MSLMRTSSMLMLATLPALMPSMAHAASLDAIAKGLVAHRALYDIQLSATHSGSQVQNISGQMSYEWKPVCGASVTDHHFKLSYEYADAPAMRIASDFSTYETDDGNHFSFTSRRSRDGSLYQELRGHAELEKKGGKAVYTMPEKLSYDLAPGAFFPQAHTMQLIDHALSGDRFFTAQIFDGSDEDGPVQINAFIGKAVDPQKNVTKNDKIDTDLLRGKAWYVRMAVFPEKAQEEESDYEMTMVFLQNGVISDMTIDYDEFSVRQRLVALEKIPAQNCENSPEVPKKP